MGCLSSCLVRIFGGWIVELIIGIGKLIWTQVILRDKKDDYRSQSEVDPADADYQSSYEDREEEMDHYSDETRTGRRSSELNKTQMVIAAVFGLITLVLLAIILSWIQLHVAFWIPNFVFLVWLAALTIWMLGSKS